MPDPTDASVVWEATISLDGYLAGAEADMSWVFEHIDPDDPGGSAARSRGNAWPQD